ncbi:MAG TPA: 2-oxoacid:acceptor oxidoreductase family protein [Desulfobacteraceae bacterium]|nr:2-oxoacid:acceptor oxidoreductase family protein [Desulfobacteraceae bacterium]HPJ67237.1 2-oxoacid:acceptor oxidoreductase family protein [Desulfobacteraceae bacterium]HPQ27383.1 2-oxoacid:acceptor oxidoreductase family protein [Desulfobacteraceae bacterium]
MKKEDINIRWHGRGGQGAITAAKIVAKATFDSGYKGVVMAPTFGTERRGAPVITSLKLSREKIYDLSPIDRPDIVVVMDYLLLEEAGVTDGLKPGGIIVINTPKPANEYEIKGIKVAAADVTAISIEAGLGGMVNAGIIGVLAKAMGFLDLKMLDDYIKEEFQGKRPEENSRAFMTSYEKTVIKEG